MSNLLSTLIKLDKKFLSWVLLLLMILFIISGYRQTGKYGMDKIMSLKTARFIHLTLDILLILLLVLHAGVYTYVKISGLIKSKHRKGKVKKPK